MLKQLRPFLLPVLSVIAVGLYSLALCAVPAAPPAVHPPRARFTVTQPVLRAAAPGLEKYEPARGAYLGVGLDYSHLSGATPASSQMVAEMRAWEQLAGRKHAIYLQFLPFPHADGHFATWDSDPAGWSTAASFCEAVGAMGATPMLTLEPQQPRLLVDNWQAGQPAFESVRAFAQAAGRWNHPLFIRFAHEMNGSWYPWDEWMDKNRNLQRDPGEDTGFDAAAYRRAYRNVAQMFRSYAPNVALVWCPNSGLLSGPRRDAFRPFYPGDDVVDWVGLDIYERGWTKPMPGAHLWGGQFAQNLTHDMADDPATPWNESVNFYQIFAQGKRKPMMIAETGATLSYRTDLSPAERTMLTDQWRVGYWNANEYGWLPQLYGTTSYTRQRLLHPIDRDFPQIKAIIYFQIAKHEDVAVQAMVNGHTELQWFDNAWTDYRIGGGAEEGSSSPFAEHEIALYRALTEVPYFLSRVAG